MKVAICCSLQYLKLIKETAVKLDSINIIPLFPNLENNTPNQNKNKKELALDHYKAIDNSDAVYFITPKGYIGTSCKLELGYAFAKQKPIFLSEKTNDEAVDYYAKEFISIIDLEKISSFI